jgi:hypothetical protein
VTVDGIYPNPSKISIVDFPSPKSNPTGIRLTNLRSFLGVISFYHRFVNHFASLVIPLYDLFKKNTNWRWERDQELAFQTIKMLLVSAPILKHPTAEGKFEVHVDASGVGVGAVLIQSDPVTNEYHPVSYISRRLTSGRIELSLQRIKVSSSCMGPHETPPLPVRSDVTGKNGQQSSALIVQEKVIRGKLACWVLILQEFDFSIDHLKEAENKVTDALSRQPVSQCSSSQPGGFMEICSMQRY